MTPYVSLYGCHGNQENIYLIFHINFPMIEMLLFIICGSFALKSTFKWWGRSLGTFWHQTQPIACSSGKWEPKTWKISAQICQKIIKMAAILKFLWPFWNSAGSLFVCLFLLENIAPSHNLILKCKIPTNSIKQGVFILPAKFKPCFFTRACK